ncbi:glycosyltransferase family 2 protein [Levilactobacillus bambusae]|uniref:Glycosyltransferase 2-like domain-containing protein n=1 Tax=Levilactobacillus bambusae TaxID=2024736 RepID=A0A2V1MY00_9LACO|nr:glycosyltransferase family A protein [Levilactobacillus bambusae]PWF99662.1 hypothetical protein DCM90_07550 [Levilactobacillus bambusae]
MFISVIVPYQNAAAYLPRFVADLAAQTYPNFDVIFINDGSTDQGPKTLSRVLAKTTLQAQQLSQPARGVSTARNLGLRQASGEYVIFADADDRLKPNYLMTLAERAFETHADIVGGQAVTRNKRGRSVIIGQAGSYEGSEALMSQFLTGTIPMNLWTKLIRRSLATQVTFDSTLCINEDRWYLYQIIQRATRGQFVATVIYDYQVNANSASRQPRFHPKYLDIATVARRIEAGSQRQHPRLARQQAYLNQMDLLRREIRGHAEPSRMRTLRNELTRLSQSGLGLSPVQRLEDFGWRYCWPVYRRLIGMDVHLYG